MSKTTLTDLINEALATRKDYQLMKVDESALQLANNALEERLQEIIETKVNQMLKRPWQTIKHRLIQSQDRATDSVAEWGCD